MFSTKTFTAIEAVLYIACQAGGNPVRSKDICTYQCVTLRYLEHILQALVRRNILKGVRGPKGGYLLAKDRRKISLCDIYDTIVTLETLPEWIHSPLGHDVMQPLFNTLKDNLREQLAMRTIDDLYQQVLDRNINTGPSHREDFEI